MSPPDFARASRRMENRDAPLQYWCFVIFPDLTGLDFTGPLQVLSRLPKSATHIVAKIEVTGAQRLRAQPRANAHLCELSAPRFALRPPAEATVSCGAIGDRGTIEFVRRQAGAAKYVTSVCTGAFILGVAGLLKGRRATTHLGITDLLPLVGLGRAGQGC